MTFESVEGQTITCPTKTKLLNRHVSPVEFFVNHVTIIEKIKFAYH